MYPYVCMYLSKILLISTVPLMVTGFFLFGQALGSQPVLMYCTAGVTGKLGLASGLRSTYLTNMIRVCVCGLWRNYQKKNSNVVNIISGKKRKKKTKYICTSFIPTRDKLTTLLCFG